MDKHSKTPVDGSMEDQIRAVAITQPSGDLEERVAADFQQVNDRASSSRWVWMAVPVAAMALWGLVQFGPWSKSANESAVSSDLTVTDAYQVIRSQVENKTVVVRETKDFVIQRVSQGESLGELRLEGVYADHLSFTNKKGEHFDRNIKDINQDVWTLLQQECSTMSALHSRGALSREHFNRLSTLSNHGIPDAIHLMETISSVENDYRAEARDHLALTVDRKVKQYDRMKTWVLTGSEESKSRALQALGEDTRSTLALSTLAQLGCELQDARVASVCINFIATFEPTQAVVALQQISEQSESQLTRKHALHVLDKMLEDMNHAGR